MKAITIILGAFAITARNGAQYTMTLAGTTESLLKDGMGGGGLRLNKANPDPLCIFPTSKSKTNDEAGNRDIHNIVDQHADIKSEAKQGLQEAKQHQSPVVFQTTSLNTGPQTPRRRRLFAQDSIINAINEELAKGEEHPHFTLVAPMPPNLFDEVQPASFELDVVLTTSSVTDETIFPSEDPTDILFQEADEPDLKFLVAAVEFENGTQTGDFAILSVDESAGVVSGIAMRDGEGLFVLSQNPNQDMTVTPIDIPNDMDFICGTDEEVVFQGVDDYDYMELNNDQVDEKEYDGKKHYHSLRSLNRLENHDVDRNLDIGATQAIQGQEGPFQVDLYIEVETRLFEILEYSKLKLKRYVATVISAVSSIFERDLSTHLHVLKVDNTTDYDNVERNNQKAMNKIKEKYGKVAWPMEQNGRSPDLIHVWFAGVSDTNNKWTGIGSTGSLCSHKNGFSLVFGMKGDPDFSVGDLGAAGTLLGEIKAVAHVLGHNFGGHDTYDKKYWNNKGGVIDSCYVDQDRAQSEIPATVEGSATIMSYCDRKLPLACAPTFGGYWNRQGDRNKLVNWKRDERIKTNFSKQPERVPYFMWHYMNSVIEHSECLTDNVYYHQHIYYILSPGANKVVTLSDGCDWGHLEILENYSYKWQKWIFREDNKIESAMCPGKLIDYDDTDKNNIEVVVHREYKKKEKSSHWQKWTLEKKQDGSGNYVLTNVDRWNNHKAAILSISSTKENGATLVLKRATGKWDQTWSLVKTFV